MHIGKYEVSQISVCNWSTDGGGLFGVIPRKLWARAYPQPAPEDNRVHMVSYALLIRGEGVTAVVDAGIGEKLDERRAAMFGLEQPPNPLLTELSQRGVNAEDVTHFLYTHLHFDHAGGSTCRAADGSVRPLFPQARHYVQAEHLRWARNPTDKDRASFMPENWEPVIESGLLEELDGNSEILPGVSVEVFHGHVRGMQVVRVAGENQAGFGAVDFVVDLVPTTAHLVPYYIAAFDNEPLVVLEEKQRYLKQAAEENRVICFGHDRGTPAATIQPAPRGYQLRETVTV